MSVPYKWVHVMQEQYHFLHMALIESLMLSSSALPSSKFLAAYDELLSYDERNRCLGIKREFEVGFVFRFNVQLGDVDTFVDGLYLPICWILNSIWFYLKKQNKATICYPSTASPQAVACNGGESVCECKDCA